MATLLEQLRSMGTVVVDAGDIGAITTFKPQEATLTASLIAAAMQMPQYQTMVEEALQKGRSGKVSAMDHLFLSFGLEILKVIQGACPWNWMGAWQTTPTSWSPVPSSWRDCSQGEALIPKGFWSKFLPLGRGSPPARY